jgi:hypothetical protein
VPTPIRQRRGDLRHGRQHHLLRLADRQTADGVAVEADADQPARALLPKFCAVAALHDAEQSMTGRRAFEGALAALGPAQRQLHGAIHLRHGGRQLQAFVELHDDVGAEQQLNLDRAFRRQLEGRAV